MRCTWLLFLLATACDSREPKLSVIQAEIFDRSCTFSSCHSERGHEAELVLEPGMSYENLIDVDPDNEWAQRAGWKRVVPGLKRVSFLMKKLKTPLSSAYGDLMPQDTEGLPEDDVELIADWIRLGAKDN
jgi:hypothetical protein